MRSSFPRFLLLHLLVPLLSCGTVQPFVPAQPLAKGTAAGVIGASFSFGRLMPLGLEARVNYGLTDRDLLGVGFSQFVLLPSDVSYVRYQELGERRYLSYQVHTYNLLGVLPLSYNPAIVAAVGFGGGSGDIEGAVSLGLGYAGPRLRIDSGASWTSDLIPYVAGATRLFRTSASVAWQPGLASRYVRHIYSAPRAGSDTVIEIPRNRIVAIDSTIDRSATEWRIRLRDSTVVTVTTREPFFREWSFISVDRPASRELDAYTASPEHRSYYVHRSVVGTTSFRDIPYAILQLDMREAIRRSTATGVLVLREDPDIVARTIDRVPRLDDDVSFAGGLYIVEW